MKKTKKKQSKSRPPDIIRLILDDHKDLKRLIKVLKDTDRDLSEREQAFEEFAPLLVMHAKPEEETLYMSMKENDEIREEGFEGEVEHQLADQMLEEAKRTDDDDIWSARVKVLAELLEHHIKEEENNLLPAFKNHSKREEREQLAEEFLDLKAELAEQGGTDSPSERDLSQETYMHY